MFEFPDFDAPSKHSSFNLRLQMPESYARFDPRMNSDMVIAAALKT